MVFDYFEDDREMEKMYLSQVRHSQPVRRGAR